MDLPAARGPLSAWLLDRLQTAPAPAFPAPDLPRDDPLGGDDLHMALYLCYELHYGGLTGVDERWEWDPGLLAFRASLERPFEAAVRSAVTRLPAPPAGPIAARLRAVVDADDGPSLSSFLSRDGTVERYREFLAHRSAYQLKEADPHSWGIPRLAGRAKAALVEIQADEYGGGDASWMHSELFGGAMRAVGLDPTPGAYLDRQPGSTLAWVNLMSLFGLHRRLRGALVGHLAAFEMTSCIPNRRYGDGLRRLGFGADATAYFDEHVEADAVHEAVAAHDLAGSLVAAEPGLEPDVVFGAQALQVVEGAFQRRVLSAWSQGRSSLLGIPVGTAA